MDTPSLPNTGSRGLNEIITWQVRCGNPAEQQTACILKRWTGRSALGSFLNFSGTRQPWREGSASAMTVAAKMRARR